MGRLLPAYRRLDGELNMQDFTRSPPVAHFGLKSDGPVIQGYAAPTNGPQPAMVNLVSDGELIAAARASRYSAAAASASIRHGWCGFELHGLGKAFAIGDQVELQCAGSGAVLHAFEIRAEMFQGPASKTRPAEKVLAAGSAGEVCDDVEQIVPFLAWHRQRYGIDQLIEATFQTVLGRWPEGAAIELWRDKLNNNQELAKFVSTLMTSDEFQGRPIRHLPGPFHQAFRLDRGLLG